MLNPNIKIENGKIYNLKTKRELIGSPNSAGYYQIAIDGKKYLRSHIIADAYCANPNNYKEVNHIDGNISNDTPENLEWVSHSENQKKRIPGGKIRKIKLLLDSCNKDQLVEIENYIKNIY